MEGDWRSDDWWEATEGHLSGGAEMTCKGRVGGGRGERHFRSEAQGTRVAVVGGLEDRKGGIL